MIRTVSDVWRGAALVLLACGSLQAQRARAAAPRAPADLRVMLVLRPYPGEMIRQRVEHDVDEQGTIALAGGDSTVRVSTRTMVVLRSRVDAVDSLGAVVTSLVESVTVRATGGKEESRRARIASGMALQGRTLRMKVAPDGELIVLDDASVQTAATIATLAALVDRVPAALPVTPVRARERWTRHMALAGAPGDGIDVQFTLDSLTHFGDFAWVSVRGLMKDVAVDAGASVTGWVLLDRRRGWITRSRMLMTMRAVMVGQGGMPPMRFVMRVEQRVGEVGGER
ncbi:MAG: hypothetical protein IT355_10695 [Gemmatimonadaceae bacterium]|nr:hypothetical protein [Gemmatimonadaceae bacterium]